MLHSLLSIELIDGPVLLASGVVAAVLLVVVVLVRPRYPLVTVVAGVGGGAIAGGGALVAAALGAFDGPLPGDAPLWIAAAGVGLGVGGVGVCSRPWWRRILAVLLVLAGVLTAGLGVNRAFGVTHTLGAILGVQTLDSHGLPAKGADGGDPATLYQRWTPPAGMPAQGTVSALTGDDAIPTGGFAARDAAIYLPPAALVPNPPALPLIVFMMGQPGSPDPTSLAAALDGFAAQHDGLAPIALVVDQLSAPDLDPACADSTTYGPVATYVNTLVPAFAESRLNVVADHRFWTIGGYSNGGACALKWGAEHPDTWGNVIDISGNEYPGSETVDDTVAKVFGGDRAAFEAAKPTSIMAANPGAYSGHTAVFTWGADDGMFGPGVQADAAAARVAGFTVLAEAIPGAGHVGSALDQGVVRAIALLAPSLGLTAP